MLSASLDLRMPQLTHRSTVRGGRAVRQGTIHVYSMPRIHI
jgi:hypothetical protein